LNPRKQRLNPSIQEEKERNPWKDGPGNNFTAAIGQQRARHSDESRGGSLGVTCSKGRD
jgi:hypothetical protein